MPKKLENLVIRGVALVDRGANQHAKILISKRAGGSVADEAQVAALRKELEDAKAAQERSAAELAELKGSGALSSDLESMKKAYDKQTKDLEKVRAELQEQLTKANKELEDSRAEAEKIKKQRRRETFIKRVQELDQLPGVPTDDFAEVLDAIDQGLHVIAPDKADKWFTKFNGLLTSWNAIVGKSKVFSEIGVSGRDTFSGPEAQLQMLAKAIQETDKGGKMTFEQAYAQALRENPALYRKYQAEQRS